MNKNVLIIITLGLVVALGIIFSSGDLKKNNTSDSNILNSTQNVEVKNGVQYITIGAKGGYYPQKLTAQAGIPTKLIVKTNGTYDCSAALVIRSINYQKILPRTGEEVIDIGIPKKGEPLQGVCGMGMYSFVVNFN